MQRARQTSWGDDSQFLVGAGRARRLGDLNPNHFQARIEKARIQATRLLPLGWGWLGPVHSRRDPSALQGKLGEDLTKSLEQLDEQEGTRQCRTPRGFPNGDVNLTTILWPTCFMCLIVPNITDLSYAGWRILEATHLVAEVEKPCSTRVTAPSPLTGAF